MSPRFSIQVLLVLSALAIPGSTASAFVTLGQWSINVVNFRVNPNFPDRSLSGTPEQQVEILRCAGDAWRDQSTTMFRFNFLGTSTRAGFNINDGINNVSWSNQDGNGALAATLIGGVGSRIDAFDTVFFDRTTGTEILWNGPQDPGTGTFDILGVGVHELGHGLGLDHTPILEATMFASARNRARTQRTLHQDDRDGAQSLYGVRSGVSFQPRINAVEPNFGPQAGGNEVVLRGMNFTWTADTVLQVDTTTVSQTLFEIESCGTLRIQSMPPHATGSVRIRIQNELGAFTLENAYRYGSPAPAILAVEPNRGPVSGGIEVTVRGENFAGNAIAVVGNRALLSQTVVDSTTIRGVLVAAPAAATVDVFVVQGLDTVTLPQAFTYVAKILRLGDASGAPEQEGVPVRALASTDEELIGLSFGLRFDPTQIATQRVSIEGTVASDAAFAAANIDNALGITTFGLVMSFESTFPSIPIGTDLHVADVVFNVRPDAVPGTDVDLRLENGLGQPIVSILFTPASSPIGIEPLTMNGIFTVIDGARFLRGDASGSGLVDLSDAVFTLDHLFRGGEPPSCEKAADSNDDGGVDISDAVYTLLFLFLGGEVIPPPYPEPGPDPTPDTLGC
jgi:hypothetical protein